MEVMERLEELRREQRSLEEKLIAQKLGEREQAKEAVAEIDRELKSLGYRRPRNLSAENLEPVLIELLRSRGGGVPDKEFNDLMRGALAERGVKTLTGLPSGLKSLAKKYKANGTWKLNGAKS